MKKPNIIREETFISQAMNEKGDILYYNVAVKKDRQTPMSFHQNDYIPLTLDQAKNNAEICSIALNTVNKGYNIEAIEEMYDIIEHSIRLVESLPNKDAIAFRYYIKQAKQALKNAKYDE